ncbi:MAG: hypothetical protein BGP06_13000 [Rhizobiales bacterium 65-9]|nr:MAG: hypothetical protein BGP06_13000 [Rhizobiales bacterium 65-9]
MRQRRRLGRQKSGEGEKAHPHERQFYQAREPPSNPPASRAMGGVDLRWRIRHIMAKKPNGRSRF